MLAQIERRDTALTDIRERLEQRVEERTRDLNAVVREQRLIVETLPLGIIHLVEDRRIARANPRAAELFGKPDIFRKKVRLRFRIDPRALKGRGLTVSAQLYDVAEVVQ